MDQDTEMLDFEEEDKPRSGESGNDAVGLQMDCFPNKEEPRFKVRKWQAVALWAYDITVDNCAICRNHIMDKCIECQSVQEMTNVDENCYIAWGKCSHVFHMHCISRWLNTRQVCPLDNRTWEFKKYGT